MDDETGSAHGQAPILRNSPTILLCFLNLARFYNLEEVPYHHHSQVPLQYSHLQNLQIMIMSIFFNSFVTFSRIKYIHNTLIIYIYYLLDSLRAFVDWKRLVCEDLRRPKPDTKIWIQLCRWLRLRVWWRIFDGQAVRFLQSYTPRLLPS